MLAEAGAEADLAFATAVSSGEEKSEREFLAEDPDALRLFGTSCSLNDSLSVLPLRSTLSMPSPVLSLVFSTKAVLLW